MHDGMPIERFGVIGDIHAQHETLERVLDHMSGRGLGTILSVGDIVDGPGDADRCCALLEQAEAWVVQGNHDRWFLEGDMRMLPDATSSAHPSTHRFLETLPATRRLQTIAGELLLCHGVGSDDMMRLTPDSFGYGLQVALEPMKERADVPLVVCGHGHVRMVERLDRHVFINAGTLLPFPQAGFVIVDLAEAQVELFDCDSVVRITCAGVVPLPPAQSRRT